MMFNCPSCMFKNGGPDRWVIILFTVFSIAVIIIVLYSLIRRLAF